VQDERPARLPLATRRIRTVGRAIRYVDEGEGPPLLFVHVGTGSFRWRDVIDRLRDRFRCVAVDVPGAPTALTAEGLEASSRVLEAFVRRLGLRDLTLVMCGLGGPVALRTAASLHERIRALVVTESFGWPPSGERPEVARALGFADVGTSGRRDDASVDAYLRGVDLALRTVLSDRPVLLVFGEQGRAAEAGVPERWRERFPDAGLLLVRGSHRSPMADAPDLVARAIKGWWREEVLAA